MLKIHPPASNRLAAFGSRWFASKRGVFLILIAAGIHSAFPGPAQAQALKGIVTDTGAAGKPISQAVVKLALAGRVDTTGTDGKFNLSTSTGIEIFAQGRRGLAPIAIEASGISIRADAPGPMRIEVRSLSGQAVYRRAEILSAGIQFLARPQLQDGMYILNALLPDQAISQRFLSLSSGMMPSGPSFRTEPARAALPSHPASAKVAAQTGVTDTLLVVAKGYQPYRHAVTLGVDTNMAIKLVPDPVVTTNGSCAQIPADPLATPKLKSLLCYLATHSYIAGQTDLGDGDKVKGLTGRYPAMIAFDFYSYTDGNAGGNAANTNAAINFGKARNGIVAFQWHWKAPSPGGRGSYNTDWDFPSALNDANSQLYKDLDLIASELKKINDAGVPVVFRPLHESNNNYMWWAKKGADNYKKLYQLMFKRITAAGAHSILWVFNGMTSGGGAASPMKNWNPGDAYDDIISGDYTQSQADFTAMQAMGDHKVIAISETMNQINPAKDAPFSFSTVWASRDWNGNSSNDWKTAMGNAKMISLDQLPDMSKW